MFTPFSIGVVAEHKKLKSKVIKVTPTEELPFLDGEIKENVVSTQYSGTSSDGGYYEGTLNTDNTLDATWLPEGTNRVTAPDVRRGERVMLYKMGEDQNKIYWRTLGLDDKLRRLETIVLAISATAQAADQELDIENCYFLEISSHKKHVTFHTSTANGEPFEYLFKFDLAAGNVVLKDDINNVVELNSPEHRITATNTDKSMMEVNRKNINMYAPQNINAVADKNISMRAGGDILGKAGGIVKFETGDTYFELRADGTTLKTPTFEGKQ